MHTRLPLSVLAWLVLPSCVPLLLLAGRSIADEGELPPVIDLTRKVKGNVVKGITHFGIYREGFAEATKVEIEWFDKHLKGEK
jgi:hypothetical protein